MTWNDLVLDSPRHTRRRTIVEFCVWPAIHSIMPPSNPDFTSNLEDSPERPRTNFTTIFVRLCDENAHGDQQRHRGKEGVEVGRTMTGQHLVSTSEARRRLTLRL